MRDRDHCIKIDSSKKSVKEKSKFFDKRTKVFWLNCFTFLLAYCVSFCCKQLAFCVPMTHANLSSESFSLVLPLTFALIFFAKAKH